MCMRAQATVFVMYHCVYLYISAVVLAETAGLVQQTASCNYSRQALPTVVRQSAVNYGEHSSHCYLSITAERKATVGYYPSPPSTPSLHC